MTLIVPNMPTADAYDIPSCLSCYCGNNKKPKKIDSEKNDKKQRKACASFPNKKVINLRRPTANKANIIMQFKTLPTALLPWRVQDSDLKIFPSHYNLERSAHVIISGDSMAPVISGRISEFARINSLFLIKWNARAPYSIRCTTDDSLCLEVTLWRTSDKLDTEQKENTRNKKSGGIIVEVRRRSGDSLDASKIKSNLFRAVSQSSKSRRMQGPRQFKEARTTAAKASSFPAGIGALKLSRQSRHHHAQDESTANADSATASVPPPRIASFQRTTSATSTISLSPPLADPPQAELLKKITHTVTRACKLISKLDMPGQNSNDGMELLDFLTDAKRHVKESNRTHVCSMILTGLDPLGKENEIRNVIHRFGMSNTNPVAHRWAIRIFGNALLNYQTYEVSPLGSTNHRDFWRPILPVLMRDMKNVENDPHVAYFAVRCVRAWIILLKTYTSSVEGDKICKRLKFLTTGKSFETGDGARRSTVDMTEFKEIILQVAAYGREKYSNIERESMALLREVTK